MKIKIFSRIVLLFILVVISLIYPVLTSVNKTTNINILMPAPFAESTSELIKEFNRKENGIVHINVTKGPRETESVSDLAISSLLLGKSPFDIILMDVTWLPKYAKAGWLEPMNEFFTNDDWNSLANGSRPGNKIEGILYRWPLTADMGLLYWRTDLMDKPPRTPEELLNITLSLKNENKVRYGYVWQGRQYEGLSCVFLEVLNGFGGQWMDESQNIYLDSKESLDAANWLNNLIKVGASPKSVTNFTENEALQAFESGDAALMRNWPYAWAELQKENSHVKGKIGITTMVSIDNKTPTSTLGSWGFSILKNTRNKKASLEAIKFLTSQESQKKLFLNNGYTPTNANLYKDIELIEKHPILKDLEIALNAAKPRPQTPLYAQISDVLQKQLSSILTDNSNVEEAMNLAKIKTNKIIRSAGEM